MRLERFWGLRKEPNKDNENYRSLRSNKGGRLILWMKKREV
jgi:hypothetical protein